MAGIATRTTNADEILLSKAQIPGLWGSSRGRRGLKSPLAALDGPLTPFSIIMARMNTTASRLLLVVASAIALAACGNATAPYQPPAFDGQYVGAWQFELRDSIRLLSPYGCGFAPCGSPPLRPYATVTCQATLEITNTGKTVYPTDKTPARELTGALMLTQCAVAYDSQPEGFVGLPPLPPPDLVSVAERTDVVGWARWEQVTPDVGWWRVGLALRNSTASIGELLGCEAESSALPWQFGALLRPEGAAQGNVAGTLVNGPFFRCSEYVLFLDSPFHLQRG